MKYSWENEDYKTEYSKKNETETIIYLHCTKRGTSGNICPGKAKFEKNSGKVLIYEKFDDTNKIHKRLEFEDFKNFYYNNNYKNIDMNLIIFQKYYVRCLFNDNKVKNYTDCVNIFKNIFTNNNFNINFKLSENIVNKIKTEVKGTMKIILLKRHVIL